MKFLKWTTCLFLSLALVSCGYNSSDDDYTPPADDGSGSGSGDGNGNDEGPIELSDLQGTWNKRCSAIGSTGFRKDTLVIGATTLDLKAQLHPTDRECVGTSTIDATANFTYVVPNFDATTNNNIDLVLTKIMAKINTEEGVVAANAKTFCGFNDWHLGEERDVTGKDCIENLPSSGGDFFQIFFLGPNRLFVGQIDDDHSGETAAERPDTLEAIPFEK